jgi:hypothetical protein
MTAVNQSGSSSSTSRWILEQEENVAPDSSLAWLHKGMTTGRDFIIGQLLKKNANLNHNSRSNGVPNMLHSRTEE